LSKAQVDAFIVSRPENIFYLCGFSGTTATLVVASDRAILVTDFRYVERAREEVSEVEVESAKDITIGLINIMSDLSTKSAAFESHFVSYDTYRRLEGKLSSIKLKPVSKEVEKFRQIKDSEEQALMTQAAKISSAAFSHIVPFLRPGVTEKEIAIELLTFMHREGAEREAFDVIVASGVRSAMPHAKTSAKEISPGDFVTIDLGVAYQGYYSDMTRTFVVGRASEKQRTIYELVREAQALALDSISSGKTGEEVDKICRDYLDKAGYGEYFLHGLGHGVGLEVHENPLVGPKGKETLQPGMVFTVEPGLYIPGFGGVRIEDMVILKEEGIEVLTKFSREMVEL
jgi:Xaa-Pro aminopeptidase